MKCEYNLGITIYQPHHKTNIIHYVSSVRTIMCCCYLIKKVHSVYTFDSFFIIFQQVKFICKNKSWIGEAAQCGLRQYQC